MNKKRRILIAMIEVGEGHKTPALAIKEGLELLFPGQFEVDVVDFLEAVGDAGLDRANKANWTWMLQHGRITTFAQTVVDEYIPVSLARAIQGLLLRWNSRKAERYLQAHGYDLLVCTHFFPLQSLAMARKRGAITPPIVALHTDVFEGHALWAEKSMDQFIVTTEQTRAFLQRKGVSLQKIHVFGYPVRAKFLNVDRDRKTTRAALKLDPTRLTVLHTAGGEGLGGEVESFVDQVIKSNLDLQYVVICGRNRALYDRLSQKANTHNGRAKLMPQGFVENMPEWIVASDLVVGKGGPGITMESLILERPIFHTSYVSRVEKHVIDFCVEHGIGAFIPKPADLVGLLNSLQGNRHRLLEISSRIQSLDFEPGTLQIAEHLAGMVENLPPERLGV